MTVKKDFSLFPSNSLKLIMAHNMFPEKIFPRDEYQESYEKFIDSALSHSKTYDIPNYIPFLDQMEDNKISK
jgi:hypothetical protein